MVLHHVLVLETLIQREIKKKRGKLYCAFVDFERAFDSINREKLWEKLRYKGVSAKIINLLRGMYRNVNVCIKCGDKEITKPIKSTVGVKQGCALSPNLFILYIDDLMERLKQRNMDALRIAGERVPGLLYADDLVICSSTIKGLQEALNELHAFCEDWLLTVNTAKTKVMAFKNGSVFAKDETWKYGGQEIERVKSFTYLGVKFSMNGKWHRQIKAAEIKGRVALKEISAMRARINEVPIKLTDTVFKSVVIPALSYGAEVWGFADACKSLERLETDYYKSTLRLARNVANAGVLREFGSTGLPMTLKLKALKFGYKIINGTNSLAKKCLLEEMTTESPVGWISSCKRLLEKIGLGDSWYEMCCGNYTAIERISQRLTDIERQEIMSETRDKTSLSLQVLHDLGWGRADYIDNLGGLARSGYAWLRMGGWKMRKIRSENGEGICVFCGEVEDWVHILLRCCATESWRIRWWGMGDFEGNDRNEFLGLRVLREKRKGIAEQVGLFIARVREIRERALKQWDESS